MRRCNSFGKDAAERARVLSDLREFEPVLRQMADTVIDSTQPLTTVVDEVLTASLHVSPGDRQDRR